MVLASNLIELALVPFLRSVSRGIHKQVRLLVAELATLLLLGHLIRTKSIMRLHKTFIAKSHKIRIRVSVLLAVLNLLLSTTLVNFALLGVTRPSQF